MKKLKTILAKKSGRSKGKVVVRHQGGRQKRFRRDIDFKRSKIDVSGRVLAIEYDPNRNADVALIQYENGSKGYILAPAGVVEGQKVMSSESAPVESGNSMSLAKIPVGTPIHNIEITFGKGGQLVKSAGSVAVIHGKEDNWVLVKLPSGEVRRVDPRCHATVGQVGNAEYRTINFRTAGRKRRMGIRPSVRGVAMHPNAHPHGGGEGRSSVGMKHPKTVYGRAAVGKTRTKKKYSNSMIVSPRKKGSHS